MIVNVSSGAGIDPSPSMVLYGASKSALEMLSQGLQKELSPSKIRVLIVQPGAFRTEMMDNINVTAKPPTDYHLDTPVGDVYGCF